MTPVCKECAQEGFPGKTIKRPAPHPGPRCATHWRAAVKKSKEREADRRRAQNFGMTGSTYREMLAFQGDRCVCGGKSRKRFAVDHDHKCCRGPTSCGRCVRGLLCARCNSTLASYGDDPAKLRALADYLEHPTTERMRDAQAHQVAVQVSSPRQEKS